MSGRSHAPWFRRVVAAPLAWLLVVATGAHAAGDRLVAVVNDEPITESEVAAFQTVAALDLLADLLQGLREQEPRPGFRGALEALVDERLLLREAEALGVAATDDEVRSTVKALNDEHRLDGLRGASETEVLRRVREQLTIVKLVNREVRSKMLINASDVDAYYRGHQDRFAQPARYRIRQIFLKAPTPEQRASLAPEAEALRAEAAGGADFGELARRRSQGPEAAHDGDLGYVRLGELLPALDAAIKYLPAGGISPVIATDVGLHIVKLVEVLPPAPRSLDEVKPDVEEFVYQEQAVSVYRGWLRRLRSRAHIDIRL